MVCSPEIRDMRPEGLACDGGSLVVVQAMPGETEWIDPAGGGALRVKQLEQELAEGPTRDGQR